MRIPTHLTDTQLIESLARCARDERSSTAQLVAHLAEMETRRIHLREGFGSLFAYCRDVLRLSESAAYKRIEAARVARRCPAILDRLGDGALTLTTVLLIGPHLKAETRDELLAAAAGKGKRAVQEMLARRFPKPDVPSLVRKLPTRDRSAPGEGPGAAATEAVSTSAGQAPPHLALATEPTDPAAAPPAAIDTRAQSPAVSASPDSSASPESPASAVWPAASSIRPSRRRPLSVPLSQDRYLVRFTASASTWRKLCMARELLRHAVPSGDPGEIVDRALSALLEQVAKRKCGTVAKPSSRDRATSPGSRHVPAKVRRAVWIRDEGRCAYVGRGRRRCGARAFLEFHHLKPYGIGGGPTVGNIELRCGPHNRYESLEFYGDLRRAVEDDSLRSESGGGSPYREDSRKSRLLQVTPASALTNSDRSSGSTP